MKKILSVLLVTVMIVSGCFILTGCGGNNGGSKKENEKTVSKLESKSDLVNFATNMAKAYKAAKEKDSAFSSKADKLGLMIAESNITLKPKSVFNEGTEENGKYVYSPSGTGTYTAEFDSSTMSIKIEYVYDNETITTEAVYNNGYYYVQVRTVETGVNDTIRWKFNDKTGQVSYTDEGLDSIYKTAPASDFIK